MTGARDTQKQACGCSVCGKAASKRCGGCLDVYYCGQDHQKLDWLRHKAQCKPFKVGEDELLGRYLVATRDIKAGEVLLREKPLLKGPSQVTGPVCLGCLQTVSQHNSDPCGRCGWPLCLTPACRDADQHRPECCWAADKRKAPVKISHFVSPHPSYECITALRLCYVKQHNPDLWARLATLERHTEHRKKSPKYLDDSKSIAQFLRRFYKLEDELTCEDIMDIWGIIQVNGHEVPVTQPPHVAVYALSSMLEHNCTPNCSKSFTNEGAIVIRAAHRIPQGNHLSICYTDGLWGTVNRQYHLLDTKYFSCKCERCLDPTELGSYYSALLCTDRGCTGAVLPENLCALTPESEWKCTHTQCGHVRSDLEVTELLQRAGEELAQLGDKDVAASLSFLTRWKVLLHPNHYYLTEVRLALVERLDRDNPKGIQCLTDEQLQFKTDLCRQLMSLLALVAPAECRVLGTLHFGLHASLAERARRDHSMGSRDVQFSLQESMKCLEETIRLLQEEPDVLPEGKLLVQAKLNKLELDKALQNLQSTMSIPFM